MILARRARVVLSAAVLASGGALLAACGNGGTSLAQQACVHVDASIRLYTQARHASTLEEARAKVDAATGQLAQALPLAARATSTDPAFNPLMTTLQEIGRTSEANLIPALRAQCAAADNPAAQAPIPSATPGGAARGLTASTSPATSPSGQ